MMNNILLTFCVPSYNRAEMTEKLVREILKYQGDDIEVFVLDNASTDNTIALLNNIEDSRLTVQVNEKNIGGAGNMMECLHHSKGLYSYTTLSRELIEYEAIPELVNFLKENTQYSLLYCGNDGAEKPNIEFSTPVESLKQFAYNSLHPDGFVFKTDLLNKAIERYERIGNYDFLGFFPHSYFTADMALEGKTLLYNKKVRIRVSSEYYNKSKSANAGITATNKILWFDPNGRLNQFDKYMEQFAKLDLSNHDKKKVLTMRYRELLGMSTISYQEMIGDEQICDHYNALPRKITFSEILKIASKIGKNYRRILYKYRLPIGLKNFILSLFPISEVCLISLKRNIMQLKRRI